MNTQIDDTSDLLPQYISRLLEIWKKSQSTYSYVYRGHANEKWDLDSSAVRRWNRSLKQSSSGQKATNTQLLAYHKDLIEDFHHRQFDIKDGREPTDLEVLALLQHYGAATSLVDFTYNPLLALWFACKDDPANPDDPNGKVYVIEGSYTNREIARSSFEQIISKLISPVNVLVWKPPPIANAKERIIAQDSVFLLWNPLTEPISLDRTVGTVQVKDTHKERLKQELAAMGLDELRLFPDLEGFARSNKIENTIRPMYPTKATLPKDILNLGITAYNQGNFVEAREEIERYLEKQRDDLKTRLLLTNIYVNLGLFKEALADLDALEMEATSSSPFLTHMFYLNRANTKAATGNYDKALEDYDRALRIMDDPLPAKFNRGNCYFSLYRFSEALEDFEACVGHPIAAFNAGNTHLALGQLNLAEEEFELAMGGAEPPLDAPYNLNKLQQVKALIGEELFYRRWEPISYPGDMVLRITIPESPKEGWQSFPIAGNSGSIGNVGWGISGGGGKGFSGLGGMSIMVIGAPDNQS